MDWTPRERLGKRLREIQHEIESDAAGDEKRDSALRAIVIEGFDTLESYERFIVAQNARIFEAVMHIAESSGDQAQLDVLAERLKAADAKFDDAAPDA